MTNHDQAAFGLYQAIKGPLSEDKATMESLLDQFFNFPSQEEFERDLDVIRKCLERKS